MGGVEDVASKAILENPPPQPVGTAPPRPTTPPPPPPPPPPLNSNLGGRRVIPNQDMEEVSAAAAAAAAAAVVGDRQIDEAQAMQEGDFTSRTSEAGQALNLSRELLVPIAAAAGEVPRDDTPNYYDWQDLFPELKPLVDGLSEIAAECAQVAAWKAWPEKHYDEGGGQDWKVFPFVHTFPAYEEARRTWIDSTCGRCPATAAILRRLPNIRTALFSRLGGGSRISGHRGWADLANHVLRCHLPLKVPSDGPCGLWVNEEVRHHVEGEIIVFDDSKLHKAFNESSGERLVLIVDILRPPGVPLGTADGEHTPELDAFIDAFR